MILPAYGTASRAVCLAFAAAILAELVGVAPAVAQSPAQPPRGQSVKDRRAQEFEPIGLRAGSFLVFPTVRVSETYNTNVFATQKNEVADFVTVITPAVRAQSDYGRHSLSFGADAAVGFYADSSDENYQDAGVNVNGRIDATSDLNFSLGAAYRRAHEARSSPDDVSSREPNLYYLTNVNGGASYKPGRFSARLNGEVNIYDHEDSVSPAGAIVNQDDRDRIEMSGSLRLGFEIKPENEGFVRLSANLKDYKDNVDDNGDNRDSNGFEVRVGTTIELTGLLEGNVYAGYLAQSYDDAGFKDVADLTAGGGLDWHVTPLTTVTGKLTRTVNETTSAETAGYITTRFAAGVQHELLRNFLVTGDLAYAQDAYQGSARDDSHINAAFDMKYLFNRNFFTGFGLAYDQRDSSVDTNDFDTSKIIFRLGGQY